MLVTKQYFWMDTEPRRFLKYLFYLFLEEGFSHIGAIVLSLVSNSFQLASNKKKMQPSIVWMYAGCLQCNRTLLQK